MKHFNVLSTVLVLIVGIWAIVEFRQRARRFPKSSLNDLWRFMIFYNAAELAVFLSLYWESNLTPAEAANLDSWYKLVEWPILTALVLVVHLSLYRAIFQRRNRAFPKWIVPAVVIFAAAEMGWFFLAMRFPALMPQGQVITFWFLLIWPLDILDIVWLGLLLAESRNEADSGRRRVDAGFARLFLIRYPVHLALTVWKPAGAAAVFWAITINKLLALYTNLLPVYWLKTRFAPWAGSLGKVLAGRFDLSALGQSRGLSAREMEILELMIDGKSYKEIESALHISIHTVKSHVYSLYRKMDVTSRHQLIHRIGIYGSAESEKRSS